MKCQKAEGVASCEGKNPEPSITDRGAGEGLGAASWANCGKTRPAKERWPQASRSEEARDSGPKLRRMGEAGAQTNAREVAGVAFRRRAKADSHFPLSQ
jgi:hypothetical protein